jgi:DNA gyrase subunit B
LEIVFPTNGDGPNEPERFYYKDGVEEFVKQLNKNKEPLHPKPIVSQGVHG